MMKEKLFVRRQSNTRWPTIACVYTYGTVPSHDHWNDVSLMYKATSCEWEANDTLSSTYFGAVSASKVHHNYWVRAGLCCSFLDKFMIYHGEGVRSVCPTSIASNV